MNYAKPEMLKVGSALDCVLSIGQVKGPDVNQDASLAHTGAAYEADE